METNTIKSVVQLNERNRQFWLEQSKLFCKQFSVETVRNKVFEIMKGEEQRGVPVRNRQSLEGALDKTYNYARQEESRIRREFSQKGGRAAKGDFLNDLIHKLVLKEPNLTRTQLLHRLKALESEGDVEVTPDEKTIILFYGNGKSKTVPVSGLKDRLFRAKKKRDSH